MKYCNLIHIEPKWESDGLALVDLYERNIERIADLLGSPRSAIPKGIRIKLEESPDAQHNPASYSKQDRLITYRFSRDYPILSDRGRLLHEATHVVQDYPVGISINHPCWCWMEGIADYCRFELDKENFKILDWAGDPQEGFRYAANFLLWLSETHPNIVPQMNQLLRECSSSITGNGDLFRKLGGLNYKELSRNYYKAKNLSNQGVQTDAAQTPRR